MSRKNWLDFALLVASALVISVVSIEAYVIWEKHNRASVSDASVTTTDTTGQVNSQANQQVGQEYDGPNGTHVFIPVAPTCRDFLAMTKTTKPAYMGYAEELYQKWADRDGDGLFPVREDTWNYWLQMCSNNPDTPFYNVVNMTYSETKTANCLGGCPSRR